MRIYFIKNNLLNQKYSLKIFIKTLRIGGIYCNTISEFLV